MTTAGTSDPRGYPAPGNEVPGAPPPLKRALTPADGVADVSSRTPVAAVEKASAAQPVSAMSQVGGGSRLIAAAAMVGVAAGLELAGVVARRHGCKC